MVTVTEAPRRFEVFTGAGHRRRWTPAEKAAIVAESFSGAESVCSVARRHGLATSQLFGWRRDVKTAMSAAVELPAFVPVVIEPPQAPAAPMPKKRRKVNSAAGIEVEIDGVVVRIGRGAEAKTVAAVIKALKAAQ